MGGEYFFADNRAGEHHINIKPKCGRLVGFQSSEFHGVQALLSVRDDFHTTRVRLDHDTNH